MENIVVYNTPHLVYWDWRVAMDLFLGGIGVGAFLVAVFNSLFNRDKYPLVSKVGAVISPLLVIVGVCFMLAEMGQPFRLFRTIIGFNPSSPLSWGGMLQGLFIILALVYAFLWFKPEKEKLRRLIGIIGIPVALGVGAYHGWLLAIVRARPLWNTGLITVVAITSFLTTGMAAVLLVLCFVPKGAEGSKSQTAFPPPRTVRTFLNLLVAALAVHAFVILIWWINLSTGSADAQAAVAAVGHAMGTLFWIVAIGIGILVPGVIQILEIATQPKGNARISIGLAALTAVLILIGGYVFRYVVLIGGQIS